VSTNQITPERIAELLQYTRRLDLERLPIIQQLGEAVDGDDKRWAAIYYGRAGIPVHPLKPGGKNPATAHGVTMQPPTYSGSGAIGRGTQTTTLGSDAACYSTCSTSTSKTTNQA
jgi:hypothetical protein